MLIYCAACWHDGCSLWQRSLATLFFFFFFIFPRGHLIFQKLSTDVAVMALRPPSPLGQLDWSWNKCNRRKLVSVKFPAAASFDSPARQNTALGVVRLCDEWAFNRDDFCLLPRVLSFFLFFSFTFYLFISYPLAVHCIPPPHLPPPPRPPQRFPCLRLRQTSVHAGRQIRCEFTSLTVGLFLPRGWRRPGLCWNIPLILCSNLEVPGIVWCVTAHSFCHVAAFCLPDVWRASIGGVASRRLFANANF